MRRHRRKAAAAALLTVTSAAIAMLRSGYDVQVADLHQGSAWVVSEQVGELTLLGGPSAEVLARVPIASPGHHLLVRQLQQDAYAIDTAAGHVFRVSGGTLARTVKTDVFGRGGTDLDVVVTGGNVYAVDARAGRVSRLDPLSLNEAASTPRLGRLDPGTWASSRAAACGPSRPTPGCSTALTWARPKSNRPLLLEPLASPRPGHGQWCSTQRATTWSGATKTAGCRTGLPFLLSSRAGLRSPWTVTSPNSWRQESSTAARVDSSHATPSGSATPKPTSDRPPGRAQCRTWRTMALERPGSWTVRAAPGRQPPSSHPTPDSTCWHNRDSSSTTIRPATWPASSRPTEPCARSTSTRTHLPPERLHPRPRRSLRTQTRSATSTIGTATTSATATTGTNTGTGTGPKSGGHTTTVRTGDARTTSGPPIGGVTEGPPGTQTGGPAAASAPPNLKVTVSPRDGAHVEGPVTFSVSAAGGGAIAAADWSFGDGSTGGGISVRHTYQSAGVKRLEVAVRFTDGRTATNTLNVVIEPAEPNIRCGMRLLQSVVANTDLVCEGAAIFIDGDDVTLDLNKHTISGSGQGFGIGVREGSRNTVQTRPRRGDGVFGRLPYRDERHRP